MYGEGYYFNSHLVKFLIPQSQWMCPGVQLNSSPEIRYNVCQSPLFSSDAFVPYFLQYLLSSKNPWDQSFYHKSPIIASVKRPRKKESSLLFPRHRIWLHDLRGGILQSNDSSWKHTNLREQVSVRHFAYLKSLKFCHLNQLPMEKFLALWDKVAFLLTSLWLIYIPTDIFYIRDKYPKFSLGLDHEIPLAIVQTILGWIFLIIAPWGLIMLGSIFVWHALMPKIPERAKRFKNEF